MPWRFAIAPRTRTSAPPRRLPFRAAAERLGVTTDQLGDRVVPWLGFEPGKPRIVECGGKQFQVAIGPEYKLTYRDIEKNKPVSSLPKSASKEILAEFKDLAVILRDVVKGRRPGSKT